MLVIITSRDPPWIWLKVWLFGPEILANCCWDSLCEIRFVCWWLSQIYDTEPPKWVMTEGNLSDGFKYAPTTALLCLKCKLNMPDVKDFDFNKKREFSLYTVFSTVFWSVFILEKQATENKCNSFKTWKQNKNYSLKSYRPNICTSLKDCAWENIC